MRPTILIALACIALGLAAPSQSSAAPANEGAGDLAKPPRPIFRGSQTAISFDISPPLRELARMTGPGAGVDHDSIHELLQAGIPAAADAAESHDHDALVQQSVGPAAMPATIVNFDGLPNLCNCLPPGPVMDVGPNHVMLVTNLSFAIYDKAGTTLLGPLPNNTIWAGFGAPCETVNDGFPSVIYDQLADRWLMAQPRYGGQPYGLCIAVSVTGDPTGSWYRWFYSTGTQLPDAPAWGMWSNAYYMGAPLFANGATYAGAGVYAFNRAAMLAGNPTPATLSFVIPAGYDAGSGLLPADLDGSTPPPTGSDGLFVGTMDDGAGAPQDALTLWRFHADFVTASNSTFSLVSTLPVTAFDSIFPCTPGTRNCIPQPGSSVKLDFDGRFQRPARRVTYRNFGTHQSVAAHQSVEAAPSMAGVRWYELRNPHGTPAVHQQGTFAPGVSDGVHRWMAGLAMDRDGNMALGYSASNATSVSPSIRYTGRLATDPPGTMPQGEGTIIAGGGSQTSTSARWGDWAPMAVDAADDCTFWYVNEYYAATSSVGWRTRVASFKFPGCGSSVSVESGDLPLSTALQVPGPSRERARIGFHLAGAATRPVALDVFDLSGRRVRRLVNETLAGGRYEVVWDGAGETGTRVGPGVYFARLRAGHEEASGTVILLR